MSRLLAPCLLLVLAAAPSCASGAERPVAIGSKSFGESYLLGEIFAQLLEADGLEVERRFGLGGTLICKEALDTGEIDVYPEYTGTITQAILRAELAATPEAIAAPLARLGLRTLPPLGFDNTYALAVDGERARREGLERISDLLPRDDLVFAFSNEFVERDDGWAGLRLAYGFDFAVNGVDHGLAYQALASGRIDVTDAYSTDGDLERYGLFVLEDDLGFFPTYLALPLARDDLPAEAAASLARLEGRIDAARMRALNARVSVDGLGFDEVAQAFLLEEGLVEAGRAMRGRRSDLLANTLRHLQLTGSALLAAVLLGLPLGVLVHRSPRSSRVVLYVASLLQTIPSIALLALLIPLLGIGWAPAVVALFLYSLLPILRATVTALLTVDPLLVRVAVGMGLTERQQVRHLLLPLAMPNVLAGVRTAAVISIGTATLAAFVGAGGLGQPIVTGLALNDPELILQGALPAAFLALATELAFEGLERRLVPAHLRSDPLH
ncbi:MAG: glycine betaine ABC transporter substrate-binding protein [Pseudomonadales bacterium]|jgi:osmoprotectant transport system permease protein|nr:glycine betaine ABC transporter substrate-binding protein [Pseudomonadales bacterium]